MPTVQIIEDGEAVLYKKVCLTYDLDPSKSAALVLIASSSEVHKWYNIDQYCMYILYLYIVANTI